MNNFEVRVLSLKTNNLSSKGVDVTRALGYKKPRNAVNKKVWKRNKDICTLFTPAVTETCACKIHTQSQDRVTETCVSKMATQGQDQHAGTYTTDVATYA